MGQDDNQTRTRAVLVVGVDLSDVSEHLLTRARDLVATVDEADLHVVHVVRPESLRQRLTEPVRSIHVTERAETESAQWQLSRLCESIVRTSGARWTVHTPVGSAADEIVRIARNVLADVIVVEVHPHPHAVRSRLFHRSAVARILENAPCSVLAIRVPTAVAESAAASAV